MSKNPSLRQLEFSDRQSWRRWLRANHDRQSEIWLVLPKKSMGGDSYRAFYEQAVDEALCYGWIDSRIRSLDRYRSLARFSPRKSQNWSQSNIDRVRELIKKRKMTRAGMRMMPPEILQP